MACRRVSAGTVTISSPQPPRAVGHRSRKSFQGVDQIVVAVAPPGGHLGPGVAITHLRFQDQQHRMRWIQALDQSREGFA